MPFDDPFPPIDPISHLGGSPPVMPRSRKRFGQRSREMYNQLAQSQKELKDLPEKPSKAWPSAVSPSAPPVEPVHFDQRV